MGSMRSDIAMLLLLLAAMLPAAQVLGSPGWVLYHALSSHK